MEHLKRKRAERFALLSFLIGIAAAAAWIPLLWLASDTASAFVHAVFLIGMPILSLVGLVLGVIGLVKSVRAETRSTKGIVFALIGIVLNLIVTAACGWLLWMYLFVHAVELA